MKVNMGSADRVIRVIIAVIFAALYFTGTVPGTLGLVLTIAGVVFLLTSFMGFCPLYTIFGISTAKKQNNS